MLKPDVITELQDMRKLAWSRIRRSSGTAGSFLKSEIRGRRKTYFKLSCYDSVNGITGHESINEIIVCRLLDALGIEHLDYQLIHALVEIEGKEYETWICASEDYKEYGESKVALDDYYEMWRNGGETPLEFCVRMGWDEYIYQMLVVDFLILNRDRHGANIEILKNKMTGVVRPAPLFDHGVSLLYNCRTEDDLQQFDPMEDKPVQSYIGSKSARENLELIPKGRMPKVNMLTDSDREALFKDLDEALPKTYQEKIWEMIQARCEYYESMQNR